MTMSSSRFKIAVRSAEICCIASYMALTILKWKAVNLISRAPLYTISQKESISERNFQCLRNLKY